MSDELPQSDPAPEIPQVSVAEHNGTDDSAAQAAPAPADTPQKDVTMSEAPGEQIAVRVQIRE